MNRFDRDRFDQMGKEALSRVEELMNSSRINELLHKREEDEKKKNCILWVLAIIGAVEAVGNKKILVVGFDATDDAVAAVKAGKMAATVAQKPNLMGETAVETAIQILQGETVEKTIPVEVELITKDTAQ